MTSRPVSVVITTCNYGVFLPRALESVFSQERPEVILEIIVVDDGSTDGTDKAIEPYLSKLKYVRQERQGQAAALNRAIPMAQGEIVALLDPDDAWYPSKLGTCLEAFLNPDVGMVQHQMEVEERGRRSRRRIHKSLSSGKVTTDVFTSRFRCMPTSALLFRKTILEKALPAPLALRTGGADHYFATVAGLLSRIESIERPLGLYRIHGANQFKDNLSEESLLAQLAVANEVFARASEVARSEAIPIGNEPARHAYAEFPVARRIDLARAKHQRRDIPFILRDYLTRYAWQEYGFGVELFVKVARMLAYAAIPPSLYRELRYWMTSHGH